MNVLLIGASRGIGHEFARQYRAEGHRVWATARDPAGLERLSQLGCEAIPLDVTEAPSAAGLGWRIDGERFDVVVYCAGLYGPRTSALEIPTMQDFDLVMHANVLGAMRVLPQLRGLLSRQAKLAVLSSRMGSIGGRESCAGWLYRASKAALNSVLRDVSLTLGSEGAVCVALHPGWVRTDMGGPSAALSAEDSVRDLRALLQRLGPEDNGRFLDHDGTPIPW
ncbi:MAG TPA: SDR family oxidoreductase [Burkholderiaceae bacterium]|nr:SDR family oxidoreductase [Burkholderiaceae bacterium]